MVLINKLKYFWQKRTRGWSDDELFNLDYEIAKFVLPRLKGFRANIVGWPSEIQWACEEDDAKAKAQWEAELDLMIQAFDIILSECLITDDKYHKVQNGLTVFGKRFQSLWQ